MKNVFYRMMFIYCVLLACLFAGCNNFFYDLLPPDENRILSFSVDGQIGSSVITEDSVDVIVNINTEINLLVPKIKISNKATLIPLTFDYLSEVFPSVDIIETAMDLYKAPDLSEFVMDLIKENPDFSIPAVDKPIDFSGPVNFIVISAQGNMRQYTVNITIDAGLPRVISFGFAKYDNPELIRDASSIVYEDTHSINSSVLYPMEMYVSYALIPSFEILGDRIEVDGAEVRSGVDAIQFVRSIGTQEKIITVWRDGKSLDFTLTIDFTEDPDSIRSIIDFRFYKADNPGISVNAVASIFNNDALGTIYVQVFYSGTQPDYLTPMFLSPGTVSVAGVTQIAGNSSHDFSQQIEYRVVSRNNLYIRTYTVNTVFIDVTAAAPVINSFKFSSALNHSVVQDTQARISENAKLIMIDARYNSPAIPYMLTPEFSATGLVTVFNAVQISGFSEQNFSRQIKYTVTNPENPLFTRDYWVQVNFIRDASLDATITSFSFHPSENPELEDEITGRINHNAGTITIFAPVGSGVSIRMMTPRFTAAGQVVVNDTIQISGTSGQIFSSPIVYTAVSANGANRKEYTVTVRELLSTIYVKPDAEGYGDGSSWQNAFRDLKSACEAAALFNEETPKEIWIAAGTYKPGANREDYFPLTANKSFFGGFAGYETSKSQRNIAANKVIISGDLGAGVYSQQLFGSFNADNTSKVINGDIAFEDITFTSARANGTGSRNMGSAVNAVQVSGANLHFTNCAFSNLQSGGAVYAQGSNVLIIDTDFTACSDSLHAIIFVSGSILGRTEFENVTIDTCSGTAIHNENNALVISNSKITNITGTAIYNADSLLEITDCEITNITGIYGIYSSGGLQAQNITLRDISTEGIHVTGGALNLDYIDASGINNSAVYFNSWANGAVIERSTFDMCGDVHIADSSYVIINDVDITNVHSAAAQGLYARSGGNISIENITIENVPNGRGMELNTASGRIAAISTAKIKNTKTTGNGGGILLTGTGNASLSGVTIDNASATGSGGAIFLSGWGNSTISGLTIDNATTTANGGGINSEQNLTISQTVIKNVTAAFGGAINLTGSGNASSISGLTIDNAAATNSGGGIYSAQNLTISGSPTVINNVSASTGGAIFLTGSSNTSSISGLTIDNAAATNSGGGIYSTQNLIISYPTAIKNVQASNGGAIALFGSGNSSSISGLTINNATSASDGGGIYSDQNLTISSPTAINNVSAFNGGAIALFGSGNTSFISGLTIDGATATATTSYSGGGGIFSEQNLNISYPTVIKNVSAATAGVYSGGGAIFLGNTYIDSKWLVCNSSISGLTIDNATASSGGGISSHHNLTISGTTVIKNVSAGTGGAICLHYSGNTSSISGLTIDGATARIQGGGIFSHHNLTISGTTVIKNVSATANGGAIYLIGSGNNISGLTIDNATARDGGGIFFEQNLTISGTTVIKNVSATSNGGAIYSVAYIYYPHETITISGLTIENATANNGGGIFIEQNLLISSSFNLIIEDSNFINVTASDYYKILYQPASAIIRRCTFVHDNNYVNHGTPSISYEMEFFNNAGTFEDCTFTNLRSNKTGSNFLFNRWGTYPASGSAGGGVTGSDAGNLTLRNCTFNLSNNSAAGILALYGGQRAGGGGSYMKADELLMEGCVINYSAGSLPVLWFHTSPQGSDESGTFRFRTNNMVNGITITNAALLTPVVNAGLVRVDNGAMPVFVP
ncbi:MAG: hypothetical protein FWB73_03740 [Treponema sp.]|nr:hypothetical protein [Treponema sp.]